MKQFLFIVSFIWFCMASSAQEVKHKTKVEYKSPSAETKMSHVHSSTHKAYGNYYPHHKFHKKHYVTHGYQAHHLVRKKYAAPNHSGSKKLKRKYKLVRKT